MFTMEWVREREVRFLSGARDCQKGSVFLAVADNLVG